MNSLRAVKLAHTLIWAFFVACILAIPLLTALDRFGLATIIVCVVGLEVLVLLFNGFSCPLTAVAARYTDDRRANFDIHLPEWLARNNKAIFGTVYVGAVLFLLTRWASS